MSKYPLLYTFVAILALSACSFSEEESEVATAPTAEELYLKGRQEFAERKFKKAVTTFEEVERQYPSSEWALSAQIMAGYTSYRAQKYHDTIAAFERFVKFHPNNESTPYAYYMIAMSYYDQITDVGRDQRMTELAMQSLREVLKRFPESSYARDAKIKLDLTHDHLAGKEMQVGRYYMERKEYLAAINRFRFVVVNHETTSHVPEALHRLVEAYLKLGIREEARRNAAVLGHNFPNSIWYRDSYALLNGGAKPVGWVEGASWYDGLNPFSDQEEAALKTPRGVAAPVVLVKDNNLGNVNKDGNEEGSSFWDSVIWW